MHSHIVNLLSPHIPLRISLAEARGLFRDALPLLREDGSLGVSLRGVEIALYETDGVVSSIWYNDPAGRESHGGREAKVTAYLSRYGDISSWERRMDNGWMHYWFNVPARAAMVYGLHNDVIRFNDWQPSMSDV